MYKYTLMLLVLPILVFSQVEKKLEAFQKAGIPTTLQELEANLYPYIEEDNAATLYEQALTLVAQKDLDSFHELEKKLRSEVALSKTLSADFETSLRELTSNNDKIFTLFHKAATIENCRFSIKLTEGFLTKTPDLYKMRFCVTLLVAKMILQTQDNHADKALQTLESALIFSNRLAQVPMLIFVVIGEAMQKTSLLGLEYLLSHKQLTLAQLNNINAMLVKNSPNKNTNKNGFVAEMCCAAEIFTQISQGNYDKKLFGNMGMKDKAELLYYRMSGKCQQDFLAYVTNIESYLKAYELVSLKEVRQATQKITPMQTSGSKFADVMTPDFRRFVYIHLENTARWHAALTAIAVEKYRLQQQKLPQDLTELIPKYLPEVALDSHGQKLRFEKQQPGYVVYGVGENAVADGGLTMEDGNNLDTAFFVKR